MVRLRYRAPVNLKDTFMKETIPTKITPRQGVESYFKPLLKEGEALNKGEIHDYNSRGFAFKLTIDLSGLQSGFYA
jgi:hypothetical protein